MTYEPPAIQERAEIGGSVIAGPVGSALKSPAWRRTDEDRGDATG
jgi:hypothetical protein